MKTKKLLTLSVTFLVMVSLCTTFVSAYAYNENISQIIGDGNTVIFVDVPDDYWAKDQINYFAQQGIVDGYEDGSFQPEAGVTREEFCKLLISTFRAPLAAPASPSFADVSADRWSYLYVETCKEFLTGYGNPFGGLPSYHPEEYATREDIAVALVRMLGLSANDAYDKNYAAWKFKDGKEISPDLVPYVSLACEKRLINGYPDGTFGPSAGITRAETVVLLNRATKQAFSDINAELGISADVVYSDDGKTATLHILAEEGTSVTVNGESIMMRNDHNGGYAGNYVYQFEEEGSKKFTIEGKKAGKTKTVSVTAKYEIGAPTLKVNDVPASTDEDSIQLKGTVSDANDYKGDISVTVNGKEASNWSGDWNYTLALKEGENRIVIVATNSLGKSTTIEKTVTFDITAPTLNVHTIPASTNEDSIKLKGTVSDVNDYKGAISVTVNGKEASNWSGDWKYTLALKEGENRIVIVATNSLGKSTTKNYTITFDIAGPTLTVNTIPASTDEDSIQLKGTVSDDNDYKGDISVTVNGKEASNWSGDWNYTLDLKEGENVITIVATNSLGKSTTKDYTVTFSAGAPEITFTNCPEVTQQKNLSIQGSVKGQNDGAKLYINDQEVYVSYSGSFSKSVTLSDGDNTYVFRAVNSYGKSTSVVKTVKYVSEIKAPSLFVDSVPATTTENMITVTGSVNDSLDPKALVYVNDKIVSSGNGSWASVITLTEGKNDIIIVATNSYGKSMTIVKQVSYSIPSVGDEVEEFVE